MGKTYKNLFLASLSGILLGLALTFHLLSFLVFVSLIPLFLALSRLDKPTKKNLFLFGFLTGLIYFFFIFSWFWAINPSTSFGIKGDIAGLLIVSVIYVISAVDMAVFWGFFVLFWPKNFDTEQGQGIKFSWWKLLSLSASFIFFEFIRSYAFGVLWAGSETFLGPHWTMGNLAYLASSSYSFLYLAQFIGIYGISLIILSLNLLLFYFIKRKNILNTLLALIIIFSAIYLPNIFLKNIPTSDSRSIRISAIQTQNDSNVDLSPKEELARFNEQINLLKEAVAQKNTPDIIVLPEASNFFKNISTFLNTLEAKDFFSKLSEKPILVIDNSRMTDDKGMIKSRTTYLDSKEGIIGWYDKRLLMPAGEYLPDSIKWVARILDPSKINFFDQYRYFNKGQEAPQPIKFRNLYIGALACSELLSPPSNRSLVQNGSDIIIIQASTGLFSGNSSIINQNLATAKMRAAENRKPLVLTANYGLSYIISSNGAVQKIAPNYLPQILTDTVVLNSKKTLYNKVGDMPWFMASFLLLACLRIKEFLVSLKQR